MLNRTIRDVRLRHRPASALLSRKPASPPISPNGGALVSTLRKCRRMRARAPPSGTAGPRSALHRTRWGNSVVKARIAKYDELYQVKALGCSSARNDEWYFRRFRISAILVCASSFESYRITVNPLSNAFESGPNNGCGWDAKSATMASPISKRDHTVQ